MLDDKSNGIFGPFKSHKEIAERWYTFTLQELHQNIAECKEDIKANHEGLKEEKEEVQPHNAETNDNSGIFLPKVHWTKEDIPAFQRQVLQLKKEIKDCENDIKDIENFEENYFRVLERFKNDNKIIKKASNDWHAYNLSFYYDWSSLQAILLEIGIAKDKEKMETFRIEKKYEKIKREEIAKRMSDLLM